MKACLITVTIVLGFLQVHLPRAYAEPGLLIIAHGAPMPEWNSPVLELGQKVAAQVRKGGYGTRF